jgi:hypothetical protein
MKQVYVVYDDDAPIAVFSVEVEAQKYAGKLEANGHPLDLYVDAAPLNPGIDNE